MDAIARVKALTFDLFGTVLDLGGRLPPHIADFLKAKGGKDRWKKNHFHS